MSGAVGLGPAGILAHDERYRGAPPRGGCSDLVLAVIADLGGLESRGVATAVALLAHAVAGPGEQSPGRAASVGPAVDSGLARSTGRDSGIGSVGVLVVCVICMGTGGDVLPWYGDGQGVNGGCMSLSPDKTFVNLQHKKPCAI